MDAFGTIMPNVKMQFSQVRDGRFGGPKFLGISDATHMPRVP
jgi:hypothetical protein